jgi:predicted outer membrane protein
MNRTAIFALFAATAAFGAAACGEKPNPEASAVVVPPEPAATPAGGVIPAATVAPDAATKTFLEDFAHFNMYAVDAGNAAIARSKNDAVKAFAQKTVDDYTALSKEVEPLSTSAGIMPPTARDAELMKKLDTLTNATSETFDAVYIAQEEAELTAAQARDKAYVETGANDTIKSFAKKRADRVTAQLAALATLKKTVK